MADRYETIDLMAVPGGGFTCANWCEYGVVTNRGDICGRCQRDELDYAVITAAYDWRETVDDIRVESALMDAIDRRKAYYDGVKAGTVDYDP